MMMERQYHLSLAMASEDDGIVITEWSLSEEQAHAVALSLGVPNGGYRIGPGSDEREILDITEGFAKYADPTWRS